MTPLDIRSKFGNPASSNALFELTERVVSLEEAVFGNGGPDDPSGLNRQLTDIDAEIGKLQRDLAGLDQNNANAIRELRAKFVELVGITARLSSVVRTRYDHGSNNTLTMESGADFEQ